MKKKNKVYRGVTLVSLLIIAGALFALFYKFTSGTEEEMSVKGEWIADGTQLVFADSEEPDGPYVLNFDGKGGYTLTMNGESEYGDYTVSTSGKVSLIKEDGMMSENCDVINDEELHCDRYASKYVKK